MPILGIWASQISGRLWAPQGAYDALATVTVPSGGAASVSFAGIPTGYKHLQIRAIVRGGSEAAVLASFNGTSGNGHALYAQGTIVGSYQETAGIALGATPNSGNTSTLFGTLISDILDYSSTNKFKTVRSFSGLEKDTTGNSYVFFQSSLWQSTAAISNIVLTLNGGASFVQNTQFALYGVK